MLISRSKLSATMFQLTFSDMFSAMEHWRTVIDENSNLYKWAKVTGCFIYYIPDKEGGG